MNQSIVCISCIRLVIKDKDPVDSHDLQTPNNSTFIDKNHLETPPHSLSSPLALICALPTTLTCWHAFHSVGTLNSNEVSCSVSYNYDSAKACETLFVFSIVEIELFKG
jgi:hypothetical protein